SGNRGSPVWATYPRNDHFVGDAVHGRPWSHSWIPSALFTPFIHHLPFCRMRFDDPRMHGWGCALLLDSHSSCSPPAQSSRGRSALPAYLGRAPPEPDVGILALVFRVAPLLRIRL